MADAGTSGNMIDRATRFGERFGFPALITIILVAGLMYGVYFVVKYEIFYNREKVEAMAGNLGVINGKVDMVSSQHSTMIMKQEASLELQSKQVSISCAQCWNSAANQTEIKRCACTPPQ